MPIPKFLTPWMGIDGEVIETASSPRTSDGNCLGNEEDPSQSTDLMEEAAFELAEERWFAQQSSKVAHLHELVDDNGRFVPRCRGRSYAKQEEDRGIGIQSLAFKSYRLYKTC